MASLLLVEDTPELRELLARGLQHSGYVVTAADNGATALRALEAGTFDVIITDIVMPDMEGLELIRKIRKAHPGMAIIAISGGGHSISESYLELAARFGAERTLQKPFGVDALVAAVQEVLATRH
jgi:DNA-binding response OmpR family regulator